MLLLKQVLNHVGLRFPAMEMATNAVDQLDLVGRPSLAHDVGFHVLIELLVRAQLGTVSGHADQAQALRVFDDELFHGGRPVHRMPIDDRVDFVLWPA